MNKMGDGTAMAFRGARSSFLSVRRHYEAIGLGADYVRRFIR